MKAVVFDGKTYAAKKEDELVARIKQLGHRPILAAIMVGDSPASRLYLDLKRKAAVRIGAEVDVYEYPARVSKKELVRRINHLDLDDTVDGMMIQMPLPPHLRADEDDIVNHIPRERDVDGLRADSPYVQAAAKAVIEILAEAMKKVNVPHGAQALVVGAEGMVGTRLVAELKKMGMKPESIDLESTEEELFKKAAASHIIVSATGTPGVITSAHVAKGAIVIDVGSPKGDVDFKNVKKKAGFITPVPGGVGPVTVACLLENLVDAAEKHLE